MLTVERRTILFFYHSSLTNSFDYGGKEKVMVGKGNGLNIFSYWSQVILLQILVCCILRMFYVCLTLPKILSNVSKLAQHNKVFIEFHVRYYLVKDIKHRQSVVLKLNDGLYKVE